MATKGGRVPIRAVCAAAGCTRGDFERALETGALDGDLIELTPGGHRKITDRDAAVSALKAFVSEQRDESEYDLTHEKARREHFEACRSELKYRHELGELMEVTEHARIVTGFGVLARERLLELPSQNSAAIREADSQLEVEKLLDAAVRKVLKELADEMGEIIDG